MVYKLSLDQIASLLSLFYGGLSMRRLTIEFRNMFHLAISPATAYRRICCETRDVDIVLHQLLAQGKEYLLKVGDIWEVDATFIKGIKLGLICVRDLKTGFIVGNAPSRTEDTCSIENALKEAKEISHKCPKTLRCDGHPAYVKVAKKVFRNRTNVEVHKRIGRMGQNQAIEGEYAVLKDRLKSMRGLHSEVRSPILLRGLIIDHNFVRPTSIVYGKTLAEIAGINIGGLIDNKWLALLSLTRQYKKNREKQRFFLQTKITTGYQMKFDSFLS
jgi:hypothetical protein